TDKGPQAVATVTDGAKKPRGKAAKDAEEQHLPTFASVAEAVMAYDFKAVGLQDAIVVRLASDRVNGEANGNRRVETTVGRLLFNEALPAGFPYVNETVQRRELSTLVA